MTLAQCDTLCQNEDGCELINFKAETGRCSRKKYGCEPFIQENNGYKLYRPTSYVPLGYNICKWNTPYTLKKAKGSCPGSTSYWLLNDKHYTP